jgi:hypothetical protein
VNVGRAYAIVRGRMSGNREKAQGILDNTPPAKRKEMNRQDSQARGAKRKKGPYKLGERLRRRR